jgi:hypothetical protein
LVGKREGKNPTGKLRFYTEYNIKMHLKEICWEDFDSIDFAQDRKKFLDAVK